MFKPQVLEECTATLQELGANPDPSAKEQAQKRETMAIAEAAQALKRLCSQEVRDKLKRFHDQCEDSSTNLTLVMLGW